jgi:hypothetical protein
LRVHPYAVPSDSVGELLFPARFHIPWDEANDHDPAQATDHDPAQATDREPADTAEPAVSPGSAGDTTGARAVEEPIPV